MQSRMFAVYMALLEDNSIKTGILHFEKPALGPEEIDALKDNPAFERPVRVVYHEEFRSKRQATKREKEIKSYPRPRKLSLLSGAALFQ